MMKKRVLFVLVECMALAGMFSCSISPDDIRVEDVRKVEAIGTTLSQSRVLVTLAVANDSRVKVTVWEANLRLHTLQRELFELAVEGPVVLPRRSEMNITLPLILRFKGGLGALGGLARLGQDPDKIQVSGIVRLKGGGMSKKHELKGVPLREFLQMLGTEPEGIKLPF